MAFLRILLLLWSSALHFLLLFSSSVASSVYLDTLIDLIKNDCNIFVKMSHIPIQICAIFDGQNLTIFVLN